MSNEEFGAYCRLFMQSWDQNPVAHIPSSGPTLAKLARCKDDAEWTRVEAAVMSRFKDAKDGTKYQKRLRDTYRALKSSLKAKSAIAKHAANARWEKEKHANALRGHSPGNANGKEKENTLSPPAGAKGPDPLIVQVRQFFHAPGQPLVWNQSDQDKLVELVRAKGWPWCEKAISGRIDEGDGKPIDTLHKREFKTKRGAANGNGIANDPRSSVRVKI